MAIKELHGNGGTLRAFVSVVATVLTISAGVIITYYSAEASQNTTIALQGQKIETQTDRFTDALNKLEKTLSEQQRILNKTSAALTTVGTRQDILIRQVEKISDKLDK